MVAHIFVDAENVPQDTGLLAVKFFDRKYEIKKVDIITQENTMPALYKNLDDDLYRIQNCNNGKNMADTWLCVEIAKTVFEEPETEVIIIISNDRDFLPAVKLSVERGKKVVMVSNSDMTNTKNFLKGVSVNPKNIEFVDYREWIIYGFLGDDNAEETGKYFKMYEKLLDNYPALSGQMRQFFAQNIRKLKYIFIAYAGKIYEVPFVNARPITFLIQTARELNIFSKTLTKRKFAAKNLLKLENGNAFLFTPEEMEIIENGVPAKFDKNFLTDILAIFSTKLEKLTTIFIKTKKGIAEIPFVNGMKKSEFEILLRRLQIVSEKNFPDDLVEKNFLKLVKGHIYFMSEEEINDSEIENAGKNLLRQMTIFIMHGGKLTEIPFVNGTPLEKFAKYLRKKKIIGKNAGIMKVLQKNFLKSENGRVYLDTDSVISD